MNRLVLVSVLQIWEFWVFLYTELVGSVPRVPTPSGSFRFLAIMLLFRTIGRLVYGLGCEAEVVSIVYEAEH